MSKFKVGDRVVQVVNSTVEDRFNFPSHKYPYLIVADANDAEGIKLNGMWCDNSRFELVTEESGYKVYCVSTAVVGGNLLREITGQDEEGYTLREAKLVLKGRLESVGKTTLTLSIAKIYSTTAQRVVTKIEREES